MNPTAGGSIPSTFSVFCGSLFPSRKLGPGGKADIQANGLNSAGATMPPFDVDFAYSADILAAWRIHASQASKTDARRFIEVYQVYRRYLWTSDVTLRTKASLISRLSKAFTLHLLQKLPARKRAAAT